MNVFVQSQYVYFSIELHTKINMHNYYYALLSVTY
jgi:hypothetical protein